MKKISCEICGSYDLLKKDGVFVCQYCGCAYSPDEMKKMMIEGTVDVSGSTIKVDNTDFLKKCLQNARRAKQEEDWEETEKYYNLVEQNDPTNIEAIFYSAYGKAKSSLVDSNLYKRQAVFKVLINCVSIIDDNFDINNEEENRKIVNQISNDIFNMEVSSYVYNQRKNGYGSVIDTDTYETITLFNELALEFMESLENIAKKFPDEEKQKKAYYYKLALSHAEYILQNGSLANPKITQNLIMKYHNTIKDLDPSHEVPSRAPAPGNRKSGCYVATAVYGSYDCPQVWTLRRYRDYKLAKTWHGKAFIKIYYAISPTIVKWFGNTEWFKNMWRKRLDNMVENLQNEGVESTPYEDEIW